VKSVVALIRVISLLMRLTYVVVYVLPPLYAKARELIEAAFSKPPPAVPPLPWPVTVDEGVGINEDRLPMREAASTRTVHRPGRHRHRAAIRNRADRDRARRDEH